MSHTQAIQTHDTEVMDSMDSCPMPHTTTARIMEAITIKNWPASRVQPYTEPSYDKQCSNVITLRHSVSYPLVTGFSKQITTRTG